MTIDEIAAYLYSLYYVHMGCDVGAWERDKESLTASSRASFMRQAEWVSFQLELAASKADRDAHEGKTPAF